jgi:hypothetical protein
MFGATMPKTAVHEHREPEFWKDEIRLAEDRLIALPAGDVMPPQQFHQGNLRILVPASANSRHHFRPLRLGENILAWMNT